MVSLAGIQVSSDRDHRCSTPRLDQGSLVVIEGFFKTCWDRVVLIT